MKFRRLCLQHGESCALLSVRSDMVFAHSYAVLRTTPVFSSLNKKRKSRIHQGVIQCSTVQTDKLGLCCIVYVTTIPAMCVIASAVQYRTLFYFISGLTNIILLQRVHAIIRLRHGQAHGAENLSLNSSLVGRIHTNMYILCVHMYSVSAFRYSRSNVASGPRSQNSPAIRVSL